MNTKVEQILKALNTTSPFHGAIASKVDFKESAEVPFLASNVQGDKLTIYFNPIEILNYTDVDLEYWFKHEINHLVSLRGNFRADPLINKIISTGE